MGVGSGGFFHLIGMILAQYLGAPSCLQRFRQDVHRLEHLPPTAEGTLTWGGAGWDDAWPQTVSGPLSPLLGVSRGLPPLSLFQCGVPLLVVEVPPTSRKHWETDIGECIGKCFENKNNISMQDMVVFLG